MEMLVKAIRRIIKVHGKEGFHSSKTFCAMIDVLVPKLERERKIFRRVLDDDILKELGELWESNAEQNNDSWKRIEETLTDEYGIREDWCRIVLDSFSKAYYNENENMSKRETSTQSQILEQEKEVINVSLQKQEQKIDENINEPKVENQISAEVLEGERTETKPNVVQDIAEKITESEIEKEISEEVLEERTEPTSNVVQDIDKLTTESEIEKEISEEVLEEEKTEPNVVQDTEEITNEPKEETKITEKLESYQNNKKLEQQVTKTAKVNTVAIMGIGGAGLNVINSIVPWQMEDFQLIGVDTDKVALQYCKADKKLLLGERINKGLREGIKPEVGEKAAKESTQMIADALKGIRILFLVGNLGGGTATGASPIIADIARKMRIFTIAVVTKPFRFEAKRLRNVEYGLERMKKNADALILLSNDVIFEVIDKKTTMLEALTVINDANLHMIQSIRNIINPNAEKHLTLTEFKTFVGMEKVVHIGMGTGKGRDKLQKALAQALNSPWLEHTISSNSQVVLQISGDINQQELDLGVLYLYQWTQVGRVISGMYYDKNKTDEISVLLVVVDK